MTCLIILWDCSVFWVSFLLSGLALCDPMNCSTLGSPLLYCLLKFAHIHIHWVGDAIQPSRPLLPLSFALNLCQHQSLLQWVGSSHQVARVLELQLQHLSFQWIFRFDFLVWSPCYPRDFQGSSPAPQFESINSLALSPFYGPTFTSVHDYSKIVALTIQTFVGEVMSLLFNNSV